MDRTMRQLSAAAFLMCTLAIAVSPWPAGAATLHRSIQGLSFGASPIQAHVGDVIEWSNDDFVAHTVTAKDGSFDVAILPGKTALTTVRHAGAIPFYCRFHPNMTGTIEAAG